MHNVPAGQDQLQATTLNQLCTDDYSATCTFTPTSEVHIDSPSHQVGASVSNNGTKVSDQTIDTKGNGRVDRQRWVDVKARVKIAKVVDVSITVHYSHEWTTSHTFGQSIPCTVRRRQG